MNLINKQNLSKSKPAQLKPFLYIAVIFVFSRYLFFGVGVRFDTTPLEYSWQLLDPYLLKNDLLRSLFYLHSQPPLFNFYVGMILKIFPQNFVYVFHTVSFLSGLVLALSLVGVMRQLRISPTLNVLLVTAFILSPASILYENWLFYTYQVTVLLVLSGVFLHKFLSTQKALYGFLFFLLLALIVLLRSLFHLGWFILSVVSLLYFFRPHWRKVLLTALIPFLIIFGLYAKNLLVFGKFTSSTWLGMSVSKLITFSLSDDERQVLIEQNRLSPFAMIPPFYPLDRYKPYLPEIKQTNIPVLDQEVKPDGTPNFNHIAYITISDQYLKDALYVLFHFPHAYLKGVARAFTFYVLPASDYWYLEKNRQRIQRWDTFYKRVFLGQFITPYWKKDEQKNLSYYLKKIGMSGVFLVCGIPLLFIYSIVVTVKAFLQRPLNSSYALTLLFLCLNIVYVTLISNLTELGENYRFRFLIEPFFLIFLGLLLEKGINKIKSGFTRKDKPEKRQDIN